MSYQLGIPSLNLPPDRFDALQAARPILCELSQIDQVRPAQRWGLLAPSVEMVQPCLDYAKAHGVPRVGLYQDRRWWDVIAASPYKRLGAIAMPQMYRQPGESDVAFQNFMVNEYAELRDVGWTVLPVLGVHKAHPPLQILSVKDVCHNVILTSEVAASQGWPGIVIFAEHRADVPPEVYPYLDRLVSTVMTLGTLPSLVWPSPPPEPPMLLTPEQRDEFELNEAVKASHDFGFDNTIRLPGTGYTEARQRVHEAVDYFRSNSNGKQDPTPNEAQAIVKMFHDFGVGGDGRAIIDTSTKYQVLLR